jgi:Type II secretion system (T2SS), protein F
VIEEAVADIRTRVHEGVPIRQPLQEIPVFPAMVGQMVKIGEETCELDAMLGKIADLYEESLIVLPLPVSVPTAHSSGDFAVTAVRGEQVERTRASHARIRSRPVRQRSHCLLEGLYVDRIKDDRADQHEVGSPVQDQAALRR